jgi:hypothetical protein
MKINADKVLLGPLCLNIQTEFVLDPRVHLRTFGTCVKVTITSQSTRLKFARASDVAGFFLRRNLGGWNLADER